MADAARTAERDLLRDSLRGFLAHHWPAAGAPARQADASALASIWQGLAAQGLTALGGDADLGGMAELAVAIEELGRAACPAPLADAFLAARALEGGADPAAAFRAALADGSACVALALGAHDGDPAAGTLAHAGGRVRGSLRFVPAGATHVLAAAGTADALLLIDLSQPGVSRQAARALGLDGWVELTVDAAPAWTAPSAVPLADLARLQRLALLARAHGAARRAFEMAVDYAKERAQFGRLIGSFQAIQHKLANCLIDLTGVALLIDRAAAAFDSGAADWRHFAAAGVSFGSPALRRVSLETQHTFGAIGYAEEHEAPRHFRRVHLDTLALGGVRRARAEIAAHLLDAPGARLPRYDLGEAGNALREAVGTWLATHWSGERKAEFDARPFHDREFDAAFARAIGTTGWIGLTWPRAHGGQARTPIEQVAFMEEMERAEAPRIGASVQATALMLFGTPEQQRRYLPEILAGEAMHGMGYSEPQAGSDLAALKTSAVRDGDGWVINGQKIWTTTWWGKYMFLAARTDPAARPAHAGISMFIVPMDTPGIKVNPAATMYDGTFANIFYDDVRVPADALVGPENGGWKVLTSALATERGLVGGGIVLKVLHAFELFCDLVRTATIDGVPMRADALVRERLARFAAEIEVGRLLMMHCAELAGSGETPPEIGAMSKVFSGELMERFGEAVLDMAGLAATLSQGAPGALANGRFEQGLRHSLMWVISIGTNEIQRNLIAQRGLGLPR
ncbi:MAG: acyl-CoA dehydrogenase [Burkholderiales bacterium]|nr:acyl-CoA dehydrogenase [Burkholderiales bacterium]